MNESYREFSLTKEGVWYRYYTTIVHPRRISPKLYRQGEEVGFIVGFMSASVMCLMTACAVMGWMI